MGLSYEVVYPLLAKCIKVHALAGSTYLYGTIFCDESKVKWYQEIVSFLFNTPRRSNSKLEKPSLPFGTSLTLLALTSIGQIILTDTTWETVQRCWLIAVGFLLSASTIVGLKYISAYISLMITYVAFYSILYRFDPEILTIKFNLPYFAYIQLSSTYFTVLSTTD